MKMADAGVLPDARTTLGLFAQVIGFIDAPSDLPKVHCMFSRSADCSR